MRSEGKKRTLELSLIQGFSKIEKFFGGATSTKVTILSLYYQLCTFLIVDNAEGGQIYRLSGSEANRAVWRVVKLCISIRNQ